MNVPLKNCVYCGALGVTGEHIYGKWSRRYGLPATNTVHTVSHLSEDGSGLLERSIGAMHKTGQIRSRQLKIACRDCNTGWMSKIVEQAIPVLKPMSFGYWGNLTQGDSEKLSAWIALFCTSSEFSDIKSVCISQRERDYLRLNSMPSKHWQISIGVLGESDKEVSLHRAFMVPSDRQWVGWRRCHAACFEFGNLIVFACHIESSSRFRFFNEFCAKNLLRQIWPLDGKPIRRPFWDHPTGTVDTLIEKFSLEFGVAGSVVDMIYGPKPKGG